MKMEGPYTWVPPAYWYADKLGGAFGFDSEVSAGASIPCGRPDPHAGAAGTRGAVEISGDAAVSRLRRLVGVCEDDAVRHRAGQPLWSRSREFLTSPATLISAPPPNVLDFSDSFPVIIAVFSKIIHHFTLLIQFPSTVAGLRLHGQMTGVRYPSKESYCLSRLHLVVQRSRQLRYSKMFAHVIWQRALDIAKQARVNWKVIIVRVGGMSKNEWHMEFSQSGEST